MMSPETHQHIRLDLNNPVFQSLLFSLSKSDQHKTLNTLRKIAKMTWQQVYADHGLKWEVILSQKGPDGNNLYSFRIGKGFRAIAYRDDSWLRLLSLHPDHDSAYQ
jgi:GH35 family endo-1,4-beta-xylanase